MPSRKLTSHCLQCGCKNHLRAGYCNQCGQRLKEPSAARDDDGRTKLYADIAHPINSTCREMIQQRVIHAFEEEKANSKQPDYISSYDDFDTDVYASPTTTRIQGAEKPRGPHKVPAEKPQPARSSASNGKFGAGIFE